MKKLGFFFLSFGLSIFFHCLFGYVLFAAIKSPNVQEKTITLNFEILSIATSSEVKDGGSKIIQEVPEPFNVEPVYSFLETTITEDILPEITESGELLVEQAKIISHAWCTTKLPNKIDEKVTKRKIKTAHPKSIKRSNRVNVKAKKGKQFTSVVTKNKTAQTSGHGTALFHANGKSGSDILLLNKLLHQGIRKNLAYHATSTTLERGKVILSFTMEKTGHIRSDAKILSSSGDNKFDQAVLTALYRSSPIKLKKSLIHALSLKLPVYLRIKQERS
jgi:TonB family protein